MMKLDDFIQEQLATDPEFREVYERTRPAFHVRRALVRARVSAGLTQEQLAERLGTTQSTIARWETGKQVPTPLTLHRVAKALGVEFIITGTEALSVRLAAVAATRSDERADDAGVQAPAPDPSAEVEAGQDAAG